MIRREMEIDMKKIILLSVVIFAVSAASAEQYTIDAQKNCLFLNKASNITEKAVKVKLKMNTAYKVSLSGEAFFSNQAGAEADPMPGVVIFYPTNEQDGFASIYRVLKPGESIKFKTPNEEDNNVFILAFVMDYWDASVNKGSYILTVEKE